MTDYTKLQGKLAAQIRGGQNFLVAADKQWSIDLTPMQLAVMNASIEQLRRVQVFIDELIEEEIEEAKCHPNATE